LNPEGKNHQRYSGVIIAKFDPQNLTENAAAEGMSTALQVLNL